MCSVESATEEVKEHKCERQNSDEEAIEWVHECMVSWGDKLITGPFGAGDAQPKPSTEKEEMNLSRNVNISSWQTRHSEIETESSNGASTTEENTEKEEMNQEKLNAARRNVEDQCTEKREMSHEDLDIARRSVDIRRRPSTLCTCNSYAAAKRTRAGESVSCLSAKHSFRKYVSP